MLKVKINIDSLDKLQKHIDYVEKMVEMRTNKDFQTFIQKKCLDTVKDYARTHLMGTTNAEYYDEYINSIHIREGNVPDGFEIVSDLTVEKPDTHHSKGYTFSISLAFEYGTGIVGAGSADAPSNYQYNVNYQKNYVKINGEYIEGWWIPKDLAADSVIWGESKNGEAVVTQGYEGMEIFRFSGSIIQQSLKKWVKEFFEKEV